MKNTYRVLKDSLLTYYKYGIIGNWIRIDASTLCQLECPICPHQKKGAMDKIGYGYLTFYNFKKFVDTHTNIKNIELSGYGEIFLNPMLLDIIRYANKKGINLSAINGVNFNSVSEEVLESMVKYRFRSICISLDGSTGDTYKVYRKGGNFSQVIRNIELINKFKKIYKTDFPILIWQFIIFGHNEHELSIARKRALELNMIFSPRFNWEPSFSPIKNKDLVRKQVGAASEKEWAQKKSQPYLPHCLNLWTSPQINWDGKLLGCCVNHWGDFGNVFESGLKKCFKSEKYMYAKKMVLKKKPPRDDISCYYCPYFKNNNGLNLLKMFYGASPITMLLRIIRNKLYF